MKTAIVIGAAKPGYSEAITRQLIKEGVFVIGTYDKEYTDAASMLLSEFNTNKLTLFEVDLTSRASMLEFVHSVDSNFDGLVFAQFFFHMETLTKFNHDLWDKSLMVNLTAPNFLIHELKYKMNRGSSNIIITSTEGYRGSYGASAYAATKAAIHNLTKSLANNLGKEGIRINTIASGWIGGEMDTDEIFNKSKELTPLRRLGSPEEIASIVSFLFSDNSSFINGTSLIADGGYLCSDPLAKYEFENNKG